jgi:hypothetical protein
MGTFAEQQAEFWQQTMESFWPALGAEDTSTTFTLYRRQRAGTPNDLGVPNDPMTSIATGVICTIVSGELMKENKHVINTQGQRQACVLEIHTAHTDLFIGDNVVLALTGLAYNVEAVNIEGVIVHVKLDHSRAQVQP